MSVFKNKKQIAKKNYVADADKKKPDDISNFKSVCIHFSKNDYEILSKITSIESRSKINAIKHALRVYAEKL
jgi:hypothetical protein